MYLKLIRFVTFVSHMSTVILSASISSAQYLKAVGRFVIICDKIFGKVKHAFTDTGCNMGGSIGVSIRAYKKHIQVIELWNKMV